MREITNANASFRTIRRSVNCPYCQTGFTFKKEETMRTWIAGGRIDPLHADCKSAAKKSISK